MEVEESVTRRLGLAGVILLAGTAQARITRIVIEHREASAYDGYEKLRWRRKTSAAWLIPRVPNRGNISLDGTDNLNRGHVLLARGWQGDIPQGGDADHRYHPGTPGPDHRRSASQPRHLKSHAEPAGG